MVVQIGNRWFIQLTMASEMLLLIDCVCVPEAATVQYLVGLKFTSSSSPCAVTSCVAAMILFVHASVSALRVAVGMPISLETSSSIWSLVNVGCCAATQSRAWFTS